MKTKVKKNERQNEKKNEKKRKKGNPKTRFQRKSFSFKTISLFQQFAIGDWMNSANSIWSRRVFGDEGDEIEDLAMDPNEAFRGRAHSDSDLLKIGALEMGH